MNTDWTRQDGYTTFKGQLWGLSDLGMRFYPLTFTPSRCINPLSPHDALKHHFTSLKTDLIVLQQRVFEGKFP